MRCIKQAVDRKFGVKTSWEKTTIAVEDVYEFNSLWYFGNTTVSPLIKLVATVCNDTPEESISKRVSNLLSQNFALRESGAKGSLCSIISGAQVIALQRNLGRGTMTWWDIKCENLYRTGLTAVGGLKAFSPIEAGLVDTMLLNYDVLKKNPRPNKNSSLAMKLQLYSSLKEDDIPNLKTFFRMWPTDKFDSALERVGLEKTAELTQEDLLLFLLGPEDVEQCKKLMRHTHTKKSISRSFIWLNKSDMTRLTPIAYWSGCLFGENDERRKSLFEIYDEIEEQTFDLRLFTDHEYYEVALDRIRRDAMPIKSHHRLMGPKRLLTYRPTTHDFENAKKIIASEWFGIHKGMSRNQGHSEFLRLKTKIHWLKDTVEETLEASGLDLISTLSLIESLKDSGAQRKLLASNTPNDTRVFSEFPRCNSFKTYDLSDSLTIVDHGDRTEILKLARLVDRLRPLGPALIHYNESHIVLRAMEDMIKKADLRRHNWADGDGLFNRMRFIRDALRGELTTDEILEGVRQVEDTIIWTVPQKSETTTERWLDKAEWKGEGIGYEYSRESGWTKLVATNDKIKKYSELPSEREVNWSVPQTSVRGDLWNFIHGSKIGLYYSSNSIKLAFQKNGVWMHGIRLKGQRSDTYIGSGMTQLDKWLRVEQVSLHQLSINSLRPSSLVSSVSRAILRTVMRQLRNVSETVNNEGLTSMSFEGAFDDDLENIMMEMMGDMGDDLDDIEDELFGESLLDDIDQLTFDEVRRSHRPELELTIDYSMTCLKSEILTSLHINFEMDHDNSTLFQDIKRRRAPTYEHEEKDGLL